MTATACLRVASILSLLGAAASSAAQEPCAVVSAVIPGLAAEKAGLREGDCLNGWAQGSEARGTLASPLDLVRLEQERGPRGPVTLEGTRGEEPLSVTLFPDEWGVETRPRTPENQEPASEAWAILQRAEGQISTDVAAARRTVREAVTRAAQPRLQAAILGRFADALRRRSLFADAAEVYDEAIRLEGLLDPDGLALARAVEGRGFAAYGLLRGLDEIRPRLEQALRILEREAPRSLAHARTQQAFAQTLRSTVQARAVMERAAALAQELAPDGLTHASILYYQAWVTPTADQRALAERALRIRERLAPESVATAQSLRLMGLSLKSFGRNDEAEAHYRRAVPLLERVEPLGSTMAGVLESLGTLALERGDLAAAGELLRRALQAREALGSGTRTAVTLQLLADVLVLRRELDDAQRHLLRAEAILEKEAPGSEFLAYGLRGLGDVAMERRDGAAAERYYRRALALFKEVNPTGFARTTTESHLGRALALAGRLDEAEAAYAEALRLIGDVVGLKATEIQHDRAALALRRSDLDAAEQWFARALAGRKQLAPGSVWEALSAHSLGVVARRRGRPEEALAFFRQAVEALEAQGRRLGGSPEASAAFRAHYVELYRDLEELLIEQGRDQEAFSILERGRARALLALLSQRELRFTEVPAALERERRQADRDYDELLEELAALKPDDPARGDLLRRFEDARHRHEDVRDRIRAAAPRLAGLRDPQPLDLDGVRRALRPGTLLLAYSLGEARSRVYAVGPGPQDFAVRDLGKSGPEIRREVEEFRAEVASRRGVLMRKALDDRSRALGRTLLGPIAARIPTARRILVVPDGVLHALPFASLRTPIDGRYLVETTAVQVVSSVTLHAHVAERRGDAGDGVVGFGDPVYPGGTATAVDTAATRALKLGVRFLPLPAARRELEALRALAPEKARLYLGAEATEERAKDMGRDARVLHFATHGWADEEFPLESGLALSMPARSADARDNGFLQAWEIFESVRIRADLVTLSACQTALGKEVAGEGLLGLTWAFQYAGAGSVLASLWEVNDAATAALMGSFYGHLRRGAATDEALRLAQVELLRRRPSSAPFFWAAFQLVGDSQ